jgi:preprotein translocase subunit YajC
VDPFSLLLIVAAGLGFYFLIIRPGQQRQKKQAEMVAALVPGAEVMTTAGILATVAAVSDEQLSLEISPGVFMRVVPAAVARVVEAPGPVIEGTGDVD